VIEFSKGKLHVCFPEAKDTDPDGWTNLERRLSEEEERFWLSLVDEIKRANKHPLPTAGIGQFSSRYLG
jgi:hypothetical protein